MISGACSDIVSLFSVSDCGHGTAAIGPDRAARAGARTVTVTNKLNLKADGQELTFAAKKVDSARPFTSTVISGAGSDIVSLFLFPIAVTEPPAARHRARQGGPDLNCDGSCPALSNCHVGVGRFPVVENGGSLTLNGSEGRFRQ